MARKRFLLAAAAAFALSAGAAQSAVFVIADFDGSFGSFSATRNGAFDDSWTFDVPEDGVASAGVVGVKVSFLPGLNYEIVSFNGIDMVDNNPDDNIAEFSIDDVSVFAGTQTVRIKGSGHGSLGGSVAFAPNAVPEPATWAMMIFGFGGVGAMMRSKRRHLAAA